MHDSKKEVETADAAGSAHSAAPGTLQGAEARSFRSVSIATNPKEQRKDSQAVVGVDGCRASADA
jgi:hypothetical protein